MTSACPTPAESILEATNATLEMTCGELSRVSCAWASQGECGSGNLGVEQTIGATERKTMKDKLDALQKAIQETFPNHDGSVGVNLFLGCDGLSITFYGCKSYEAGSELLRSMGVGTRNKEILEATSKRPWVNVTGKIGEHDLAVYCDGLPPSCKLETYIERIPKEQTVTTGEFVEVERTKVVCGGSHD